MSTMLIQQIPISKLLVLPGVQSRSSLDTKTVEEYAEALRPKEGDQPSDVQPGDTFPAIEAVFDPVSDRYIVSDGFHRHAAYVAVHGANSDVMIDVWVRPQCDGYTPVEVATFYSCIANQTHGLRRNREDKVNAVRLYLSLPGNAGKSDAMIAKELRVQRYHVAEGRKPNGSGCTIVQPAEMFDMPLDSNVSSTTVRMGQDGKSYTIRPKESMSLKESDKAVQDYGMNEPCVSTRFSVDDISVDDILGDGEPDRVPPDNQVAYDIQPGSYSECGRLHNEGVYDGRKLRKAIAQLKDKVDDLGSLESTVADLNVAGHAFYNLRIAIETLQNYGDIPIEQLQKAMQTRQAAFDAAQKRLATMRQFMNDFDSRAEGLLKLCSSTAEQKLMAEIQQQFAPFKERYEQVINFIANAPIKTLSVYEAVPPIEWFTSLPDVEQPQ